MGMRTGSEASHASKKQSLAFHSHVNRNNRPEQASGMNWELYFSFSNWACQIKISSIVFFSVSFFLAEQFGGTSSLIEKKTFSFSPFRFSSCFSVAWGGVHARLIEVELSRIEVELFRSEFELFLLHNEVFSRHGTFWLEVNFFPQRSFSHYKEESSTQLVKGNTFLHSRASTGRPVSFEWRNCCSQRRRRGVWDFFLRNPNVWPA